METPTVNIPANFTDAGKILGMFEIRNTVEALIVSVPPAVLLFRALPFGLTAKAIICAVFLVPAAGFCLTGVLDYSLLTFLRIYFRWRKNRRVLTSEEGETS
jgi:hypothetical protein